MRLSVVKILYYKMDKREIIRLGLEETSILQIEADLLKSSYKIIKDSSLVDRQFELYRDIGEAKVLFIVSKIIN